MSTPIKAAICREHHGPFTIEEASLGDIRANEIKVRMVASGICHTDMAVQHAQLPTPLPGILGHEGAGIVEEIGADVDHVKPGDRVIMTFGSCGDCTACDRDLPTYCYNFFPHNFSGARADGSETVTQDGDVIHANFFSQSSFATHAIATARNVVKLPDAADDLPLERFAPIGCGLMTGAGAVLRSLDVQPGLPIAIYGTGAVGLAAVMAARLRGASPIIAVDMQDSRLKLARELGATHTVQAEQDVAAFIKDLVPQGLAYAFDTTGVAKVIEGAFALLAPKGQLGIVGASDPEATLEFNESEFMGGGRTVTGILGGDSNISPFLTELMELHLKGDFPFERLIRYFDFDDINEAVEASESGEVVKPVLRISPE